VDYIQMWDLLSDVELQPDQDDKHIFSLGSDGCYSAKAVYEGLTLFVPYIRVWKTCAPPKCRFFIWFAAHKRYWTADRLAKRGLDHLASCPLYDQEAETLDHLLVSCVLSRVFWFQPLQLFGLQNLSPRPSTSDFMNWWESASVIDQAKNGFNSFRPCLFVSDCIRNRST
jgi:hypothetical protein